MNRHSPVPPPPPATSSEAAILEYDRANLWVAKVLEVRAADSQHVYLRVFWLYWPDELPMGRQPYHGANELIMSNAMEIVDAMTVSSAAEVKRWHEDDDDREQDDLGEKFWRQFLDVQKLGISKLSMSALTEVRRHCICQDFYNPDETMFKCARTEQGCGIWNHEKCLVDAILQQTYQRLVENSGPATSPSGITGKDSAPEDPTRDTPMSTGRFPAGKLADLVEDKCTSGTAAETRLPPSILSTKSTTTTNRRGSNVTRPWIGKFSVDFVKVEETPGSQEVKLMITDERGQDPETWTEAVHCLKCDHVLE